MADTADIAAMPPGGDGTPPAVSARRYLRDGLPALYQEDDFGMRFVGALETVLDPVVGTLDGLPHMFSSDLAPARVLRLLAAWLGVEIDESWPEERTRELIRRAADGARRRGTHAGLTEALRIAFPDLPLRVEDGGGVVHALDPAELPPAGPPQFVVYCDTPLEAPAMLARMIEEMKPVHVNYRLRVRVPKRGDGT
jgi:phage tail-like protein